MPRLSRADSQKDTRDRLLAAGRDEFLRLGYGRATLDGIAEAAGFSKGAVYSNFASKEALFLELLRLKLETDIAAAQGIADGANTVEGALQKVGAWLSASGDVLDFTLVATESLSQASRSETARAQCARLYLKQREALADLLHRLFALAGREPPTPLADGAAALVSITLGVALQRGLDPETFPASRWAAIARHYLELLLSG